MKLTDSEKLNFIMLGEIYKKLGITDGVDPKFVQEAIFSGNAWGLKWKYPGIFDIDENPKDVRDEVLNVLDMWSLMERSYKDLSLAGKAHVKEEANPFGENVRFPGFDGNNEGEYMSAARFLVEQLERYIDFKGRADLNSHMRSRFTAHWSRSCRAHALYRSSGSASSTCLQWRYFGRSWPTYSPPSARAPHEQLAAARVGREISSANRCKTPLDASAGSCQAGQRGTSRAGLAKAKSSIPTMPGRSHGAAAGVHASGQY